MRVFPAHATGSVRPGRHLSGDTRRTPHVSHPRKPRPQPYPRTLPTPWMLSPESYRLGLAGPEEVVKPIRRDPDGNHGEQHRAVRGLGQCAQDTVGAPGLVRSGMQRGRR